MMNARNHTARRCSILLAVPSMVCVFPLPVCVVFVCLAACQGPFLCQQQQNQPMECHLPVHTQTCTHCSHPRLMSAAHGFPQTNQLQQQGMRRLNAKHSEYLKPSFPLPCPASGPNTASKAKVLIALVLGSATNTCGPFMQFQRK